MIRLITLLTIALVLITLNGCSWGVSGKHSQVASAEIANSLSLEEKHRLYSAALAASDSPLDSALFKEVCQKIGIFGADGNPNGSYMAFVQEHVAWSMNSEANQFRSEINTKEKAQQYVTANLP